MAKSKTINAAFGQHLKAVREAAALTQHELAAKSGVGIGTIREVEQGRREPLFGVMQRLSAALAVSMHDFPPTTTPPPASRKKGK